MFGSHVDVAEQRVPESVPLRAQVLYKGKRKQRRSQGVTLARCRDAAAPLPDE